MGARRKSQLAFQAVGCRPSAVMPIPPPLDPPARLLCGPGPSDVEPSVLAAMRRPMLGHLDPTSTRSSTRSWRMLRAVWRMPEGDVLRAAVDRHVRRWRPGIANLLEPGDTVIVGRGRLLRPPARRDGASATARASSGAARRWGETVPERARCSTRSTAIPRRGWSRSCTPRPRPARSTRCASWATALLGYDALLMADCVTSLGGVPLDVGALGGRLRLLAARRSASAAPPGMAPVAISPRALASEIARAAHAGAVLARPRAAARLLGRAARRPTTTRRRSSRSTRCTRRCGSCSTRGSRRAGRATPRPARTCRRRSRERGLELLAAPGPPARAADRGARAGGRRRQGACSARMLAEHGIEIGGGLGPGAPPIWRIGLMGRNATDRRGRARPRRARQRPRAGRRSRSRESRPGIAGCRLLARKPAATSTAAVNRSAGFQHLDPTRTSPRVPRIVVTRGLPEPALARAARRAAPTCGCRRRTGRSSATSCTPRCAGADAVVAMLHDRVDDALLDAAGEQLRVVANVAVGYDNVDVDAARQPRRARSRTRPAC